MSELRATGLAFAAASAWVLAIACPACGHRSGPPPAADSGPARSVAATPADAGPPAAAARLREVRGDVRWQAASGASWQPAREGQELGPGDAVQTMADGSAIIVFLETGSAARLDYDTTLRVPAQAPQTSRFRHLRGLLIAHVGPDASGRLEVELPPGTLVLEATGASGADEAAETEAHVEITKNKTAVTMLDGRGRLERREGPALTIATQRFVEVDEGGQVLAEGESPPVVELASPPDGAAVISRGRVDLEWLAPEGADAAVVEVTADDGRVVSTRVPAPVARMQVQLDAGAYRWTVRAEAQGRTGVVLTRRSFTVTLDLAPPALSIVSPTSGATVSGGTVRVAGTTEPGAQVEINGDRAAVAADGSFNAEIAIPRGLTNVVVRATDAAGNERTAARAVLRE
jgi:hypothetical protein